MIGTDDRRYIRDIPFENADDFLKAISYGGELFFLQNGNYIFRGHESDKYELVPTALRKYLFLDGYSYEVLKEKAIVAGMTENFQVFAESQILKDFFDLCDSQGLNIPEVKRLRESRMFPVDKGTFVYLERWLPKDLEGIAALAQHHGLPTRLLDWTLNLYTALYFASSGAIKLQVEPQRMTRDEWQKQFLDSSRSAIENFFNEKHIEKDEDRMEIWAFNKNLAMANLDKSNLCLIHPRYSGNPNLCAQDGLFTCWGMDKPMLNDLLGEDKEKVKIVDQECFDKKLVRALKLFKAKEEVYLYRLTVPYEAATDIYHYVRKNGKDASTLFPGYDGVERCMTENKRCEKLVSRLERKSQIDNSKE